MRRILALYLPMWPIERHLRSSPGSATPDKPFALWQHQNQTLRIYAVCPVAAALGLAKDMTLAEARAIAPDLMLASADPAADRRSLDGLARWLVRYSPLVATDDEDGLLIDTTGCAHLFGGEQAMMSEIEHKLADAGITARLAMAENRAAAWALARHRAGIICTASNSMEVLDTLPVRALDLDAAMAQKLVRLGLKTIGSLLDQPRPALARRFRGHPAKNVSALLTRLDLILGKRNDPISPLAPLPSWQVRQAFAEPVSHLETVEHATEALIEDLCTVLMETHQGVRRLRLSAFRVDGTVQDILIGTNRPSRDKAHLMRLFREKLDGLQAEFGFDLLLLAALETEVLAPAQIGDLRAEEATSAAKLLDRLAARLGPGAVARLRHHASHLPERAQTLAPVGETRLGWDDLPTDMPPRPIRLLPRPEIVDVLAAVPEGAPQRFQWRRVEHRVTKAEGPERIACEWWINPGENTRDYYRVEVEGGSRFWLFRHGLYSVPGLRAGESAAPQWYLHGFFA